MDILIINSSLKLDHGNCFHNTNIILYIPSGIVASVIEYGGAGGGSLEKETYQMIIGMNKNAWFVTISDKN